MVYNVSEILEDLDGHEGIGDREIKIKLADGSVREIAGFEFRNACIGGDDIIYIKEENPLKMKYEKDIRIFLSFARRILKVCQEEYDKQSGNDDFDPAEIFDIENEIAKQADFYIRRCKLEKEVIKRLGFFEPGTGSEYEASDKLEVLEKFII